MERLSTSNGQVANQTMDKLFAGVNNHSLKYMRLLVLFLFDQGGWVGGSLVGLLGGTGGWVFVSG